MSDLSTLKVPRGSLLSEESVLCLVLTPQQALECGYGAISSLFVDYGDGDRYFSRIDPNGYLDHFDFWPDHILAVIVDGELISAQPISGATERLCLENVL